MPKKFQGENSKAVVAKAKKAQAEKVGINMLSAPNIQYHSLFWNILQEKTDKKKQEEEDALWEDNDKQVAKKQQRKVRAMFYHFSTDCAY